MVKAETPIKPPATPSFDFPELVDDPLDEESLDDEEPEPEPDPEDDPDPEFCLPPPLVSDYCEVSVLTDPSTVPKPEEPADFK